MASTSRASGKRVGDAEIFQVLEESTDSDVTVFSMRKMKMVMNPTVTKMDSWMTVLKQNGIIFVSTILSAPHILRKC
jgi:hypothetical protein